jgi:hypothetical protein
VADNRSEAKLVEQQKEMGNDKGIIWQDIGTVVFQMLNLKYL